MSRNWSVIITCEHASDFIPRKYQDLLQRFDQHQVFDPGAKGLARWLGKRWAVPLFEGRISRLVCDLNRSAHHPKISYLPKKLHSDVLEWIYVPFRSEVESAIRKLIQRDQNILHLSVHSFVRTLGGQKRKGQLAFLYDPSRIRERELAADWTRDLRSRGWDVLRNYPYRGTADGHTTALRKQFKGHRYAGIELEVCQDQFGPARNRDLYQSIATVIEESF